MRRITRIALIVSWILLAALTHLPPVTIPKTGGDKYAHFGAYLVLGFLLSLAMGARGVTLKSTIVSIAIACAYGAADELTQPLVGRICDLRDWYADALGSITGALIVLGLSRFGRAVSFALRA